MNSKEYWSAREAEQRKHYAAQEDEYDRQIKQIYQDMLDGVQKEIESFYGRYADKEKISISEAKKRVSKLDIEAYERKAKRYVREKNFSEQANAEMDLYNATMKINRLEMLKANMGMELIAGHDELNRFMGGVLKGRTEEELKRQAGILGKTVLNNAQKADAIPNASFHNAKFSDRIWMYQDLMKADLSKLLQRGLIQGKNPRVLAKELRKYLLGTDDGKGGAKYNTERLMRSELARVQTGAQQQSFDRNGFEEYTFIANKGCCPICAALNGKHFKVRDMMPGENASPMHTGCMCSAAAYEDSENYEEWLDYLDKGGTTENWEKLKKQREMVANAGENGIINLYRKSVNTGAFSVLPERMSKKHIREIAREYAVDLKGITLNIDENEELLRIQYCGRADPEGVGGITFFPNAFRSKEELLRTIYHEKVHVEQYKKHGVDYVQANRGYFEDLTYDAEDRFIDKIKKEGAL